MPLNVIPAVIQIKQGIGTDNIGKDTILHREIPWYSSFDDRVRSFNHWHQIGCDSTKFRIIKMEWSVGIENDVIISFIHNVDEMTIVQSNIGVLTVTAHQIVTVRIAHRIILDDQIVNVPVLSTIKHINIRIITTTTNIGKPVGERTDVIFERDGDVLVQWDRLQNTRIEFKIITVIPNHFFVLSVENRNENVADQHSIDQIRDME